MALRFRRPLSSHTGFFCLCSDAFCLCLCGFHGGLRISSSLNIHLGLLCKPVCFLLSELCSYVVLFLLPLESVCRFDVGMRRIVVGRLGSKVQ
ncbi:hypothetical protein DFH08DRAFT_847178 [Mycena albidolilacea]|uniref:Uncharacterized protein n=1 Tax=Mycena albidolilacea TaxID=1033008 RepID=A0AAD7AIX2_9AGAR|nr:hypothetical protein DFH08DRAFT_847178 [Mycena albidolilacea]